MSDDHPNSDDAVEALIVTLVNRAAEVQDAELSEALRDAMIREAKARFSAVLTADDFLIMVGAVQSLTSAMLETWAKQTNTPRGILYAVAAEILAAIFATRSKMKDPGAGTAIH